MSLVIKKATKADAGVLLTLLEEARKYKLSLGDDAWGDHPFTEKDVELRLKVGESYLAYIDEDVVSSITLLWDDEHNWGEIGTNQKAGYIHGMMVGNAFRGRQIGKQMIVWAIKQIADNRRGFARLDCPAKNSKLCGYYEKLGFKCVDTRNGSAFYELPIPKD